MNEKFSKLGFYPADILLPNKDVDMEKWAVVACDQFTSEPEYWERVEKTVGDAPSTLRLILPEANLKAPNVDEFIADINASMDKYLKENIFETLKDSLIYIERGQSDGKIRHGLIGMVDLDQYDFTPGSGALIRATEGTVLDRIPPRARVRRNAPIELPHVMLLIDDPDKTVIEPLTAAADGMEKVYDFDLMENGGHIKGFKLSAAQIDAVADALTGLTTDEAMKSKYGVSGVAPLLFAVGDGNHSLATAKACYEEQKKGKTPEEYLALPARYALVEVVNNHDDALQFEPIHRVLFGVDHEKFMEEFKKFYPNTHEGKGEGHAIEVCWAGHPIPRCSLPSARSRRSSTSTSRGSAARWTTSTATRSPASSAPRRATWASCCPRWARSSCSRPSWPTACCPARPSRWVTRRISATTSRLARSDNQSRRKRPLAGAFSDRRTIR